MASDEIMHAVHFWGQERGLPVTEKERRREGKRRISPRMKYGHANHISIKQFTNQNVNAIHTSLRQS